MQDDLTQHFDDAMPTVNVLPRQVRKLPIGDMVHDMNKALEREVIIARVTDPGTDLDASFITGSLTTPNNILFTVNPLLTLLNDPFINPRLSNFHYFSYDSIKLKIKWNTNPTVSGLYYLFHYFTPGLEPLNQGLACITGFPGMKLDINSKTSGEMEIP